MLFVSQVEVNEQILEQFCIGTVAIFALRTARFGITEADPSARWLAACCLR
jgi:hypothetical protein